MRVVFVVKVVHEGGDLHFRLDFAIAVAFLQHSGELFRLTTQYGEVVVGELAPLLPNFTFYLMPLALQDIFGCVHVSTSLWIVPVPVLKSRTMPVGPPHGIGPTALKDLQ